MPVRAEGADVAKAGPFGPPSFAHDLLNSLGAARSAVRGLPELDDPDSDVSVTALTALVCTGETAADALQAAAEIARRAPGLKVQALSWAMVPIDSGTTEYRVTMTVTSPTPGESEPHRDS